MSVVCLAVFSTHIVRPGPVVGGILAHTQQSLLERLLILYCLVRYLAGVVAMDTSRWVRIRVVFGEDAGAIVDCEDENRLDAEEGERARHGIVLLRLRAAECTCWGV